MSQSKCPLCLTPLRAVLESYDTTGVEIYRLRVEGAPDRLDILRESLVRYWRWKAEGEKPNAKSGQKNGQYYYDPYHHHIEYLEAEKLYKFSIQTCDSPDGDTWWNGTFKLSRLMEIQLVEEGTSAI